MDEIKQKKKMLMEVLLVAAFFVLVVCGLIYTFHKIVESQPVQSSIAFVSEERELLKQNIKDTKLWVKNLKDNTYYKIGEALPWLHLDTKPVEALENTTPDNASLDVATPSDGSFPPPAENQAQPQETNPQPKN